MWALVRAALFCLGFIRKGAQSGCVDTAATCNKCNRATGAQTILYDNICYAYGGDKPASLADTFNGAYAKCNSTFLGNFGGFSKGRVATFKSPTHMACVMDSLRAFGIDQPTIIGAVYDWSTGDNTSFANYNYMCGDLTCTKGSITSGWGPNSVKPYDTTTNTEIYIVIDPTKQFNFYSHCQKITTAFPVLCEMTCDNFDDGVDPTAWAGLYNKSSSTKTKYGAWSELCTASKTPASPCDTTTTSTTTPSTTTSTTLTSTSTSTSTLTPARTTSSTTSTSADSTSTAAPETTKVLTTSPSTTASASSASTTDSSSSSTPASSSTTASSGTIGSSSTNTATPTTPASASGSTPTGTSSSSASSKTSILSTTGSQSSTTITSSPTTNSAALSTTSDLTSAGLPTSAPSSPIPISSTTTATVVSTSPGFTDLTSPIGSSTTTDPCADSGRCTTSATLSAVPSTSATKSTSPSSTTAAPTSPKPSSTGSSASAPYSSIQSSTSPITAAMGPTTSSSMAIPATTTKLTSLSLTATLTNSHKSSTFGQSSSSSISSTDASSSPQTTSSSQTQAPSITTSTSTTVLTSSTGSSSSNAISSSSSAESSAMATRITAIFSTKTTASTPATSPAAASPSVLDSSLPTSVATSSLSTAGSSSNTRITSNIDGATSAMTSTPSASATSAMPSTSTNNSASTGTASGISLSTLDSSTSTSVPQDSSIPVDASPSEVGTPASTSALPSTMLMNASSSESTINAVSSTPSATSATSESSTAGGTSESTTVDSASSTSTSVSATSREYAVSITSNPAEGSPTAQTDSRTQTSEQFTLGISTSASVSSSHEVGSSSSIVTYETSMSSTSPASSSLPTFTSQQSTTLSSSSTVTSPIEPPSDSLMAALEASPSSASPTFASTAAVDTTSSTLSSYSTTYAAETASSQDMQTAPGPTPRSLETATTSFNVADGFMQLDYQADAVEATSDVSTGKTTETEATVTDDAPLQATASTTSGKTTVYMDFSTASESQRSTDTEALDPNEVRADTSAVQLNTDSGFTSSIARLSRSTLGQETSATSTSAPKSSSTVPATRLETTAATTSNPQSTTSKESSLSTAAIETTALFASSALLNSSTLASTLTSTAISSTIILLYSSAAQTSPNPQEETIEFEVPTSAAADVTSTTSEDDSLESTTTGDEADMTTISDPQTSKTISLAQAVTISNVATSSAAGNADISSQVSTDASTETKMDIASFSIADAVQSTITDVPPTDRVSSENRNTAGSGVTPVGQSHPTMSVISSTAPPQLDSFQTSTEVAYSEISSLGASSSIVITDSSKSLLTGAPALESTALPSIPSSSTVSLRTSQLSDQPSGQTLGPVNISIATSESSAAITAMSSSLPSVTNPVLSAATSLPSPSEMTSRQAAKVASTAEDASGTSSISNAMINFTDSISISGSDIQNSTFQEQSTDNKETTAPNPSGLQSTRPSDDDTRKTSSTPVNSARTFLSTASPDLESVSRSPPLLPSSISYAPAAAPAESTPVSSAQSPTEPSISPSTQKQASPSAEPASVTSRMPTAASDKQSPASVSSAAASLGTFEEGSSPGYPTPVASQETSVGSENPSVHTQTASLPLSASSANTDVISSVPTNPSAAIPESGYMSTPAPRMHGRELDPMSERNRSIALILHSLGCVWLIVTVGACLLLGLITDWKGIDRRYPMSQEISLLCAHILILLFNDKSDQVPLCQWSAVGIHYFTLVFFSCMCIESLRTFMIIVGVTTRRTQEWVNIGLVVGWVAPMCIVAGTASGYFNNYDAPYACWMNLGSDVAYFTMGPVGVVAAGTLIFSESAGVYGPGLSLKPNKEMHDSYNSGLVARHAAFAILPLSLASWAVGFSSVYYQRLYAYATVFGINVALGCVIFFFHALQNVKIRAFLNAIWKKIVAKLQPRSY